MRRATVGTLLCFAMAASALSYAPAPAAGVDTWVRPVVGPVVRAFAAPRTRYGAGHLGVDFAAAPGTAVRAAGTGTVVFAGLVANARHVVVRHAGGMRTSYSFLASIRVHTGEAVARGAVLGTAGGTGQNHAAGVAHFGLRIGATFVDPMRLFSAPASPVRVHLAPIVSSPGRSEGASAERRALIAATHGPPAPILLADPAPAASAEAAAEPMAISTGAISMCVRLVALRGPGPVGAPLRPG
jgi:murein DD-endopeptidase MepM/ murein hydrolase activator NlpD